MLSFRISILISSSLFFTNTVLSQYYYKDIILLRQGQEHWQQLKKNKVSLIQLNSFEPTGEKTEGFNCSEEINNSHTQSRMETNSPVAGLSSTINRYNGLGQLIHSVDSSTALFSQYDYVYDEQGRLKELRNSSGSPGERSRTTESHFWSYDSAGTPKGMIKVKNLYDTTIFLFKLDEHGLVAEEVQVQKGLEKEKVYYYHDARGHLTDVVRYHDKLKKLLPELYFNYDQDGLVLEMFTLQSGKDNLTWRYQYDDHGLRSTETCFDNKKTTLGRITYQYTYRK